jgi:hypothetical protein
MNIKLYLSGLLLLLSGTYLAAQPSDHQCLWHGGDIHNLTLRDYHQDENILYLISNNQDYLYLNLAIPDSNDQKKLLIFGLTIYVDASGKSKKDLAIMYPFRRAGGRYRSSSFTENDTLSGTQDTPGTQTYPPWTGDGNRQRRPGMRLMMNFDELKYDLAEQTRRIALKGYTDTADLISIPNTNPFEVHGWMAYDSSDVLYYTLAIPFAKIPIRENMKTSGFSMGIASGYFDLEAMMANRPGRPGSPGGAEGTARGGQGGGGQGGPGGGRPGGQGGRARMTPEQIQAMREQRQVLSTPFEFWVKKIKLAENE